MLDHIVERKRQEVARQKRRLPPDYLRELVGLAPPVRAFAAALRQGEGPRVIAEVKRASPSRGVLRPTLPPTHWSPTELASQYAAGGARALSVLTDVTFFWGHPDWLTEVKEQLTLPVLRKDFLLEPYQVDEARWLGADAVLLIASILDQHMLHACAQRARDLGMDVLVEVHADAELPLALDVPGAVIGINHRNLHTMSMDMERSARLLEQIPPERVVVAESGVARREVVQGLMARGIRAFLVGEHLAASSHPVEALRELRSA